MTTAQTQTITGQLPAAATAIAGAWGLADALTVGEMHTTAPDLAFASQAVAVRFSGSVAGELVLAVDGEIAQQLMDSPAAPADLIAALAPATTAALLALGEVTPTSSQILPPAAAVAAVLDLADSACAPLIDEGEVRALVALGAKPAPESPAEGLTTNIPPQTRPAAQTGTQSARLDLLRGVQMQATVELGRTSMTINELLTLRSGAVVELDRAAGAPADLYVNGRLIAQGEVVIIDENYGLRVLKVVADDVEAAR